MDCCSSLFYGKYHLFVNAQYVKSQFLAEVIPFPIKMQLYAKSIKQQTFLSICARLLKDSFHFHPIKKIYCQIYMHLWQVPLSRSKELSCTNASLLSFFQGNTLFPLFMGELNCNKTALFLFFGILYSVQREQIGMTQ